MTMSAEFCRLQAAEQQQRAAESPLDNVRRIAVLAAATWEGEALAAERRERRRLVARAATETARQASYDIALGGNPHGDSAAGPASAAWTRTVQ
jgi:hypothetical protein